MTESIVREVIHYRVAPGLEKGFCSELLPRMRFLVTQMNGCLAFETLADIDKPNHYIDIVTWQSRAKLLHAQRTLNGIGSSDERRESQSYRQILSRQQLNHLSDWCHDENHWQEAS